jgi:outer membrane receptor protein involved in Fe transport
MSLTLRTRRGWPTRVADGAWLYAPITVLVLFASAALAFAQASTGGVRGIVRDETGAVLAGLTVEAESPARIGGAAVETTNSQGMYEFQGLPIGTYTVTFSLQGFRTVRRENVRVEVGRTVELDMSLALGTVAETVTVAGGAPVVDTLNAGTSSTLSKDLLESVPTTRTFYLELVTFTPAIVANGNPIFETINIYGSNSDQNSYQIDGVDVSTPGSGIQWDYTSYNVIEAVEVKAIGASAEYTGFQGGVVNVVTKSGSNTFRGLGAVYAVPTPFVGNNTPSERFPYHVDYQTEVAGMFGGPLKKDRLWFNAIYTGNWQRIAQVGVDPTFASAWNTWKPFVKVTARPSSKDNLDFTFNNMVYNLPDDASRTTPKQTTNTYIGQNPMFMGHWSRTLGSRTVFEARAGGVYVRDNYNPTSGDFSTPGHYDVATGVSSVNSLSATRTVNNRTNIDATLSHVADDFIKGSHDFKFGVQMVRASTGSFNSLTGGRSYYDLSGAPYYILTRQPSALAGRIRQAGGFAQDNWTVNDRVTLNLGVRYDWTTGDVPSVDQLDNQNSNPTGKSFGGISDLIAFNNWSPRVGATVKLDDVGKTVAKASYGRYQGVLRTGMFQAISRGNTVTNALLYDPVTRVFDTPFYSVNPNSNYAVDPNLTNQYTNQFFVGLERELVSDLGLDILYIHKKEHNFIRLADVRGVYVPQPFVDTFSGVTQTLTVFNRASPSSQSLYEVTNRTDFRQDYDSVIVQANKRFSKRWTAQTSYTWQRSFGYTRGNQGATAQSFSALGPTGFGRDPNDVINAYGRLPSDAVNAVKVSGSYQAPYGLTLGIRYGVSTGRPYSRLITVRGLRQGNRTVIAEPSGTYRLPTINDLQVRVEKDLAVVGAQRLRLSLDALNLLNTIPVVTLRNNSSTAGAAFGQALSVLSPRQVMLGARYEF